MSRTEKHIEQFKNNLDGFTFMMFPEILECIRLGDVQLLEEREKLTDFEAYYEEVLKEESYYSRAMYFIMGTMLNEAWHGGLPMTEGVALCDYYSKRVKMISSKDEFMTFFFNVEYEFTKAVSEHRLKSAGHPAVSECMRFIDAHISEPIDRERLAGFCHYSQDHLRHIVKRYTGKSINELIRSRRAEKAAYYLRYTDYNGSIIAQKLGYGSQSYFIRQFRQEMGMSPEEYRRNQTSELYKHVENYQ